MSERNNRQEQKTPTREQLSIQDTAPYHTVPIKEIPEEVVDIITAPSTDPTPISDADIIDEQFDDATPTNVRSEAITPITISTTPETDTAGMRILRRPGEKNTTEKKTDETDLPTPKTVPLSGIVRPQKKI